MLFFLTEQIKKTPEIPDHPKIVDDVFVNLLANGIWVVSGILLTVLIKYVFKKLPAKRLWSLYDPQNYIVCMASTSADTGQYIRHSTGIGQVRALSYVVTSLNTAYRKIDARKILLSAEDIGQLIENDIVILGGSKNNRIARLFLRKIDDLNIVNQSPEGFIYWQKTNLIYRAEFENGEVIKDYGIIVKMANPFSTDKPTKVILFGGCHTYGTLAAAKYFCKNFYKKFKLKEDKNICILVSCDVVNGYPVKLESLDYVEF